MVSWKLLKNLGKKVLNNIKISSKMEPLGGGEGRSLGSLFPLLEPRCAPDTPRRATRPPQTTPEPHFHWFFNEFSKIFQWFLLNFECIFILVLVCGVRSKSPGLLGLGHKALQGLSILGMAEELWIRFVQSLKSESDSLSRVKEPFFQNLASYQRSGAENRFVHITSARRISWW